jgi:hypothetical protein
LYFAQDRRHKLQEKHPDVKNTDISRMLGEVWRDATEEERQPYVDKEIAAREIYKVDMAKWRKAEETKQDLLRKSNMAPGAPLPYNHMGMYVPGAEQYGFVPPQPYHPYAPMPSPHPMMYGTPMPAPVYAYGK